MAGSAYARRVRLSDFWNRMERRFGTAYARSYAADQVLATLDGRTVQQAIDAGDDLKGVWRAVVEAVGAAPVDR